MTYKILMTTIIITLFSSLSLVDSENYSQCQVFFSGNNVKHDKKTVVKLPLILQIEFDKKQIYWYSYWEFIETESNHSKCLLIEGSNTNNILVKFCNSNNTIASFSSFIPGESMWPNVFSLYITVNYNGNLNIYFNQRSMKQYKHNYLHTLRFINTSSGGPKINTIPTYVGGEFNQCIIMKNCVKFKNWSYFSCHPNNDSIYIIDNFNKDMALIRVTLSNCFPTYNIGILPSGNYRLKIKYDLYDIYHTLSVSIIDSNNINFVIIKNTVEKNNLNCLNDLFLVGVQRNYVSLNCNPHWKMIKNKNKNNNVTVIITKKYNNNVTIITTNNILLHILFLCNFLLYIK
ncbi:hypothetical protein TCON_1623 [Astathelohania contejeani]|uniref:Uncharacterized protein n=1 Tax=Astathelohania contejeani TaxID=164912 RepID=A0ABQ7HYA9_9MICR|nr:hypothetical protein TCON_1623 [Thelohania contejeani]